MPSTAAPTSLPYPALTDAPNGPAQLQALADRIDSFYPRGQLAGGFKQITTTPAAVEAETVVPGLPCTVTLFTARRYRVTFHTVGVFPNAADLRAFFRFRYEAGTTVSTAGTQFNASRLALPNIANRATSADVMVPLTGVSGQVTIGVTLTREFGAAGNTVQVLAGTADPAFLMVEDIGPA